MIKAVIFDFSNVLYPYDGQLVALVRGLRRRYKLAILSALSASSLRQFLEDHNLTDLFDEVISASDLGHSKADEHIYELAAERLGLEPAEIIFVDDETHRVKVAVDTGMRGVVYRDARQLEQDLKSILHA